MPVKGLNIKSNLGNIFHIARKYAATDTKITTHLLKMWYIYVVKVVLRVGPIH